MLGPLAANTGRSISLGSSLSALPELYLDTPRAVLIMSQGPRGGKREGGTGRRTGALLPIAVEISLASFQPHCHINTKDGAFCPICVHANRHVVMVVAEERLLRKIINV